MKTKRKRHLSEDLFLLTNTVLNNVTICKVNKFSKVAFCENLKMQFFK